MACPVRARHARRARSLRSSIRAPPGLRPRIVPRLVLAVADSRLPALPAVESEVPCGHRGVDEGAVVRHRPCVNVRPEVGAGDAHAVERNLPLCLQRADDLHQHGEERRLLGLRKGPGRRGEELWPCARHSWPACVPRPSARAGVRAGGARLGVRVTSSLSTSTRTESLTVGSVTPRRLASSLPVWRPSMASAARICPCVGDRPSSLA